MLDNLRKKRLVINRHIDGTLPPKEVFIWTEIDEKIPCDASLLTEALFRESQYSVFTYS